MLIWLIFPFFLLGNGLIPLAILLFGVYFCLSGFFIGLKAAYVAYNDGITKAFKKMYDWAKEYDERSNEIIYEKKISFL